MQYVVQEDRRRWQMVPLVTAWFESTIAKPVQKLYVVRGGKGADLGCASKRLQVVWAGPHEPPTASLS